MLAARSALLAATLMRRAPPLARSAMVGSVLFVTRPSCRLRLPFCSRLLPAGGREEQMRGLRSRQLCEVQPVWFHGYALILSCRPCCAAWTVACNASAVSRATSRRVLAQLRAPSVPRAQCPRPAALRVPLAASPPTTASTPPPRARPCRSNGARVSVSPLPLSTGPLPPCSGIGRYAPDRGMSECATCEPGKFAPSAGASMCQNCTAGTYSLSGAAKCDACPKGFYSSEPGKKRALCAQAPRTTVRPR